MDVWDLVKFPSDNSEETFHLSERQSSANSGLLYDIDTVAVISASQNSKNPAVCTSMIDSHLCISINSTVLTFEDYCQHLLGITKFDSLLDCISLSQDSNFLITGSHDGTITLTYLPLNNCILTQALITTVDKDVHAVFRNASFVPQYGDEKSCSIISLSEGNGIFYFTNVQLSRILSAIETGDNLLMQEILSMISKHDISFACKDISVMTHFGKSNLLFALNADASLFSMADFKIKAALSIDACFGYKMVKARITSDGRYALVLDSSKTINVLNLKTFIVVERWASMQVMDFTLIETIENSSCTCLDIKVLILTCSTTNRCFLQLVEFPSTREFFSFEVSSSTYLIDMPENQDCILFLEASKNKDRDLVTNIKIRKITEASQKARLSRLLNKCQFDEALNFALTFNMNVEAVYFAKVKYLFDQLLQWKASVHVPEKRSILKAELFSCLSKISDINRVVACCVNASLPCLSDTREILLYAKSKLKMGQNVNDGLATQVYKTLNKLDIFNHIFGESEFSSSWENFLEADLWEELLHNLARKRLDIVSLLWEHNIENFLQRLSVHKLSGLLEVVPDALITQATFRCWLEHSVLPPILNHTPDLLETIAFWVIQNVSTMELIDKNDWPNNAILFIQMFIDVCQELSYSASLTSINLNVELALLIGKRKSVFDKIYNLLDCLHDLRVLHQTYKCKISLVDYMQEDKEIVIFELLEWINAPEEIPVFVNDFLKAFTKSHNLGIHEVVYNYIQDVLQSTNFDWWYWEEPPWEKQILTLIDCLDDEEMKLKAICQTLRVTPVPWSSAIQRKVNQSLTSKHPLIDAIKREIEHVDQKMVYIKYGFQKYDISDKDIAKTLARFILQQNDPSSVADALVVIHAFKLSVIDAYVFRMKYLIASNKLLDFCGFLENLPPCMAVPCCKRLMLLTLDVNICEWSQVLFFDKYVFTQAAIYALRYLERHMNPFEFEDYHQLKEVFSCLQCCQIHFGVRLNIKCFNSINICKSILENNVESFLINEKFDFKAEHQVSTSSTENERKQSREKPGFQQLFYLSQMLGFKQQDAWSIIAKKALELDKFDLVVIACEELCSAYLMAEVAIVNVDLFHFFIDLWVKKMSSSSAFNGIFLKILAKLVGSAAVSCDEYYLEWCGSLSHWVYVLKNVHYKGQFTNVEILLAPVLSETNPYNDWVFTILYKEKVLQVEHRSILLHVNTCIQWCADVWPVNMVTESSTFASKSFFAAVTELIKILESKRQFLLAQHIFIGGIIMLLSIIDNEKEHSAVVSANSEHGQKLTRSILINVFAQRQLDVPFILGLLLNLPMSIAVCALKSMEFRSGFDYRKLRNIAVVGIELSKKYSIPHLSAHYQSLFNEAEWGRKLSKLHINFKDVFQKPHNEKMALITQLASHVQIEVPFISQYCAAFHLDLEQALLSILDLLLTCIYSKNPPVKQSAIAYNRTQTEIFQICSSAIQKIDNKSLVFDKLNRIYSKVDPYNYEILQFILENTYKLTYLDNDVILEKAKKALDVLNFLKTYKRVGEPSEYERDVLFEEYNESFDHNSRIKDRLPFHLLLMPISAMKILAPELTVDTIDIWLPVAPILQVCKNDMIMVAVENLVRHAFPKPVASLTLQQMWNTKAPDSHSLHATYKLVSRIDDLEKAVACCTSVVKRLPPSSCKVLATKEAMCVVNSWWEATGKKKAEYALHGLQKLFNALSCIEILYEYGLEDPQYLSLSEQPQELICKLLEHPSIECRHWFNSKRFPDIYSACVKIADNTNCNLESVQRSLLAKWLLPNEYALGALDETMIEDLNLPVLNLGENWDENFSQDDQNLKRAIYVLQRGAFKGDVSYVFSILFSSSSVVTHQQKLTALKCLLHVTDKESIESCIQERFTDVCKFAEQLYCGSRLELLNISCELPSASEPSMFQDLALQLLQCYSRNATALVLAAELCIHSKLNVSQIWNTILKFMTEAKLYSSLKDVLNSLTTHSLVCHTQEYVNAWTAVLKYDTIDKNEDARGLNKLILLHRCPVLIDLDLISLAEYFNHLSLPILAIDCLIHVPDKLQGMQHIKNFVTSTNLQCIMQHLKELHQAASSLYHLSEVAKVVYLTLANKGFIMDPHFPYLDWFENFMMSKAEFNSLLTYTAQKKMWNECCILVHLHYKLNPHAYEAQEAEKHDTKGIALLKMYAKIGKCEEIINLLDND